MRRQYQTRLAVCKTSVLNSVLSPSPLLIFGTPGQLLKVSAKFLALFDLGRGSKSSQPCAEGNVLFAIL